MRKWFLLLAAFAGGAFAAQGITVSKDSLRIHNNPVSGAVEDPREPVHDGGPCNDLACDSQSVRKILDRNGMESIPVSRVVRIAGGRIVSLELTYNAVAAASLPKQVKVVPPEIGNLTALTSFSASGNEFDSLPNRIAGCENLQSISIDHDRLTTIPDSIVKCTRLSDFRVESSLLTRLPDSIGKLKSLRSLCVVKNHLTTLPLSITDLDSVACLFIADNRICALPQAVIDWMGGVQTNRNCTRPEPVWPDSQKCTAAVMHTPDRQRTPGLAAGAIVRGAGFMTLRLGPANGETHRIELFDLSGRIAAAMSVPTEPHAAKTVRLNTAGLPAGWYYLRVSSRASRMIGGSFVVER